MEDQSIFKKSSNFIKNSVSVKMFTIGFLILILLIPAAMVNSLMRERKARHDEVVNEISFKWGKEQVVAGPILTIPYKKYFKDADGDTTFSIENMHFLPKNLSVSGTIKPEMRYRSIYEVVVYNTKLELSGSFAYPQYEELNVDTDNIMWSSAFVSLGISDMRGIKENISASMNSQGIEMNPGIDSKDILGSGVSAKVTIPKSGDDIPFAFTLNLNGSDQAQFIPVGETTTVNLSSDWPSPSFSGAFLPIERKISDDGFKADWKILHLNRNYPQYWIGSKHKIVDSAFGVKLFIAADLYQQAMRTAKYAIMFILFTFTAFFFAEIMNKKRIHPIQYLLIGFAITIFYTLLISISEHISFDLAYLVSSASIIMLITGYSKGILRSNFFSLTVFGILTLLYAYLYMVLQLEDYALLIGSIGLFTVLSLIMYMTRKIDWYALTFEDQKEQENLQS